jgi:mono/diheme cytochrome c family protein
MLLFSSLKTMKTRHFLLTIAAVLVAALASRGLAQTPPPAGQPAAPLTLSTKSGVYTDAQATKGEDTYMNICVSCHPAGTYTGSSFKTTWGGRPLADLFEFISTKMPEDDPGSLKPEQYAAVIAYMLKINKLPSGKADLPDDVAALKLIKLELDGK